jgi:hypothetical protein
MYSSDELKNIRSNILSETKIVLKNNSFEMFLDRIDFKLVIKFDYHEFGEYDVYAYCEKTFTDEVISNNDLLNRFLSSKRREKNLKDLLSK